MSFATYKILNKVTRAFVFHTNKPTRLSRLPIRTHQNNQPPRLWPSRIGSPPTSFHHALLRGHAPPRYVELCMSRQIQPYHRTFQVTFNLMCPTIDYLVRTIGPPSHVTVPPPFEVKSTFRPTCQALIPSSCCLCSVQHDNIDMVAPAPT